MSINWQIHSNSLLHRMLLLSPSLHMYTCILHTLGWTHDRICNGMTHAMVWVSVSYAKHMWRSGDHIWFLCGDICNTDSARYNHMCDICVDLMLCTRTEQGIKRNAQATTKYNMLRWQNEIAKVDIQTCIYSKMLLLSFSSSSNKLCESAVPPIISVVVCFFDGFLCCSCCWFYSLKELIYYSKFSWRTVRHTMCTNSSYQFHLFVCWFRCCCCCYCYFK